MVQRCLQLSKFLPTSPDRRHATGLAIEQKLADQGRCRSVSIAAASILAKVERDRMMVAIGSNLSAVRPRSTTKATALPSISKRCASTAPRRCTATPSPPFANPRAGPPPPPNLPCPSICQLSPFPPSHRLCLHPYVGAGFSRALPHANKRQMPRVSSRMAIPRHRTSPPGTVIVFQTLPRRFVDPAFSRVLTYLGLFFARLCRLIRAARGRGATGTFR